MVQLGCNTLYPLGRLTDEAQFDAAALQVSLKTIASAGFHAVEYSHIGQLSDEDLGRVKEATYKLRLIPWSAHCWTDVPGEQSDVARAISELTRCVQQCSILGVRILVLHCGGAIIESTPPENVQAIRQANLAVLRPVCEAAAAIGVSVALENGWSWGHWQYLIYLVDVSVLANLGLNVDTGHARLGELGVERAITSAGSRIRTTHLQDNFGEVDDHLPPGEGVINWLETLRAFRSTRYSGIYMVEMSDCPPNREPDPEHETFVACENLRSFFAELGEEVAPPVSVASQDSPA